MLWFLILFMVLFIIIHIGIYAIPLLLVDTRKILMIYLRFGHYCTTGGLAIGNEVSGMGMEVHGPRVSLACAMS